jgi:hypothetical protein
MHLQIRTSPEDGEGPDEGLDGQDRLRARLDALAHAGVDIEGVAPELATTHLRFVFRHDQLEAALAALVPWSPTPHHAIAVAVEARPGGLRRSVDRLVEADYHVESVLVLAGRHGDDVVVSIGVDRAVPRADWIGLGGIDAPDEMPPEELSAS